MTLIEDPHTVNRVECDKPACPAVLRPPKGTSTFSRTTDELLVTHGWTVWASRSRRFYCPDHRPDDAKTNMRLVVGS